MMGIAEQVEGLEVVLRAEEDLYLRLREILRREEQELVALEPAQIAEIVDRKQSLAEEARLLEDSRRALTSGLARALGLGDGAISLSNLIAALYGEARALPELHARLSALIRATRSLLESNGAFADRSLRRVQETLRMLGRAVPEKVGYGPGISRGDPTLGRGRLVRAAI